MLMLYRISSDSIYIMIYNIIMNYGNVINKDTHILVILSDIQSYDK